MIDKNTSQGQILIPLAHYSCLLRDDSVSRTARELWWTNQLHSSVWRHSNMVLHAPGDEQEARWWPQFKDIVSPIDAIIILFSETVIVHWHPLRLEFSLAKVTFGESG
jgi:hypothetical protein